MTFSEIAGRLKKSRVGAKRKSWKDAECFVCWDTDKALFNIWENNEMRTWYWDGADEFEKAVDDLTADDWALVSAI